MALVSQGSLVCKDRLIKQVTEFPRKVIVTMGNHATRIILNNPNLKITQIRGALFPSPLASIGVIPAVHPAALLRGTGNYRQFKADIQYAFDLLRGLPPKKPIEPTWEVAESPSDVRRFVLELFDKPYIASDVETGGFDPLEDEILAIGMCADPEKAYIVPGELVSHLKPLFEHKGPKFIYHNGKFDMRFVRRDISPAARVDEDTMLLSYTLDENGGIHDLEQVAGDMIGAPDYKHMLRPYLPKKATSYRVIPKDVLYKYLALDTSNTRQIFSPLRNQVNEDRKLQMLYEKVLLKSSEYLYKIEKRGIMVCPNRVERQGRKLQKEIDDAYARLQAQVRARGIAEVNPSSPKQLAAFLFDVLKLVPPRRGSRSTAKEVLDALPKHAFIVALREYRKAQKAKSTYVDSLKRNVKRDGRVHATFLIHGTRTGRLSSRKPNMQNVPRSTELRGMYMAAPGYVFIKVDLNQAELRSLACTSLDEYLLEVYLSNTRSLHKETAEEFYPGWKSRKDTPQGKEELIRAKAVNFGVVYGRTAESLADEYKIPVQEAQKWIDRWFKRSPKAKAFIDRCRAAPITGTTLVTPFGRKKRHMIVTRENLQGLQNEASNFPHQSIASEICGLGAARAADILEPFGIYPVNAVHDETMFECPDIPEVIAWAKWVIEQCMESIAPEWGLDAVPFKAEGDVGRRWSIYRSIKYDYKPATTEQGYAPPDNVREAIRSFNSHLPVLGSMPEDTAPEALPYYLRIRQQGDPEDHDLDEDLADGDVDDLTPYGFVKTDDSHPE
jgi:DNA polymerase-1